MQPEQTPVVQPNYDFIVNPAKPPGKSLFSGSSLQKRLIMACLGLFALLIIFSVAAKLLGGGKQAFPTLLAVAQQQQQLIQLTGNDISNAQNVTISTTNTNFAATTQLTVSSSQQQLLAYLKQNGYTPATKLLSQKVNSSLDQQLTTAGTAGTFDSTFDSIVVTQLNSYGQDLRQAYSQTTGPKGRALLKSDYAQAQLLLQQLNSPAS